MDAVVRSEVAAMIQAAVSAAYSQAAAQLGVAENHADTQQPAASTVAVVGTSGAPTGIIKTTLTPKVTGKYRVHFSAIVTPLNTAAHKVTAQIGFAQGTGAINPFLPAAAQLTLNPVGMPLTTAGEEGGAMVSWTLETTALGTVGVPSQWGIALFGDDTTSLQVSGGGAQLTVEEIF